MSKMSQIGLYTRITRVRTQTDLARHAYVMDSATIRLIIDKIGTVRLECESKHNLKD